MSDSKVVSITGGAPPKRKIFLQPDPEIGVQLDNFVCYMPMHSYIFKPSREMWPASSVDARVPAQLIAGRDKPMAASLWLEKR